MKQHGTYRQADMNSEHEQHRAKKEPNPNMEPRETRNQHEDIDMIQT